jgi:hypothetical protein
MTVMVLRRLMWRREEIPHYSLFPKGLLAVRADKVVATRAELIVRMHQVAAVRTAE